ncbi:MAG TPA: ATP-binding protein [Kineosporiaceae bacterium]
MILQRLTVREKVNLLVVIPLTAVLLLQVPLFANQLDSSRQAARDAQMARTARQVGRLVRQVQQLRLLSVAYLGTPAAAPSQLVVAEQELDALLATVLAGLGGQDVPTLTAAIDRESDLRSVSEAVRQRLTTANRAIADYSTYLDGVLRALDVERDDGTGRLARDFAALGELQRSDEIASNQAVLLLTAVQSPEARARLLSQADGQGQAHAALSDQFRRLTTPAAVALFDLADGGDAASRLDAARTEIGRLGSAPASAALAGRVYAAAQSQLQLRQMVQTRVTQDVVNGAEAAVSQARLGTAGLAALALLTLISAITLTVRVGRSVSRPLRELTDAAGLVADLAQEELLRVADEDTFHAAPPQLSGIEVHSQDEIGELGRAFNRVQATAALLLERQVVGRRNIAAMFAGVGRRTANLVGRQVALIDTLERAEDDPDTLATLYRLDHAASRLRRTASSLVVLSGASESLGDGRPLTVADAVRVSLGTVEDFRRVTLRGLPPSFVAPGAVGDVVLLFAELIENAVSFSPPRTSVEVTGSVDDAGCHLVIVDHGMGMPDDRLAAENERLRRRERLDLAPSEVLGLFVVGRISRRYGITVGLQPTPKGGVTARVDLPVSLLVDGSAVGATTPVGRGAPRRRGPGPGATARRRAAVAGRPAESPSGVVWTGADALTESTLASLPPLILPDPAPRRTTPVAPSAVGRSPAVDDAMRSAGAADADPFPEGSADVPRRVPGSHWRPDALATGRRVPGAALADLERQRGSAPSGRVAPPAGGIDPLATRRSLDDVEAALARARDDARSDRPPSAAPGTSTFVARRGAAAAGGDPGAARADSAAELGTSEAPAGPSPGADGPSRADQDRAGVQRRVPGAALRQLQALAGPVAPAGATADPGAPADAGRFATGPIDAEQLRRNLSEVDDAVQRAALAPEEPIARPRHQNLGGTHEPDHLPSAAGELADALLSGSVPFPGNDRFPGNGRAAPDGVAGAPGPGLPTRADTTEDPEDGRTPPAPVRRTPGASLAALQLADPKPAPVGRPGLPPARPVPGVPARPEEVRAWFEALEAVFPRSPAPEAVPDDDTHRAKEAPTGSLGPVRTGDQEP